MNCFNREIFLPIYDFVALEAEPEYTPPPAPKSFDEYLRQSGIIIVRGISVKDIK